MKDKCHLWWCFRKATKGLNIGGIETIWYCDKHAYIADEILITREIKSKIPIDYTPLDKK